MGCFNKLIPTSDNKDLMLAILSRIKDKVLIYAIHNHTVSGGIINQHVEPSVAASYLQKWNLDDWDVYIEPSTFIHATGNYNKL